MNVLDMVKWVKLFGVEFNNMPLNFTFVGIDIWIIGEGESSLTQLNSLATCQ